MKCGKGRVNPSPGPVACLSQASFLVELKNDLRIRYTPIGDFMGDPIRAKGLIGVPLRL